MVTKPKMEIIMFAGPNGSGKSTLINDFLYNPKHQGLLYVCPDAFFPLLYPNPPTDHEEYKKCYITTMELAEKIRTTLIDEGREFVFETVFSTNEKIDFLKNARRKGFWVREYILPYLHYRGHGRTIRY